MILPQGVPPGWHLEHSGTREPTLVLPATHALPSVPNFINGVDGMRRVSLTRSGTAVTISLQLSSPAQIVTRQLRSSVQLNVGIPATRTTRISQAPPAIASPTASAGEVIRLNYADVSEVAGVLVGGQQTISNDIFHPTGSIFSLPTSSGLGVSQPEPAYNAQNATMPVGERISDTVAIDRRLNAIILSGPPDQVATMRQLIRQLDVPLTSVMLECQIVELTQRAARDLGLDLSGAAGAPSVQGSVIIQNGGEGIGGLQASASLEARLYATIANGGGKLIATPKIATLDGTPAQILIGDAIPIIQTTIFPGPSAITQVSTNYVTVGVNLQIQPRIAADGNITSHIFAEISSVTQFVSTPQGSVPQISLRQASTEAVATDGSPLVIGGLLKDDEIETMSKIPFLGDLPVLGGLFRSRHDSTTQTNLYIIITPHIIRPLQRPAVQSTA